MFVPRLEKPSSKMVNALAGRAGKIGGLAKLLKVFLPYLVWNTVFDNTRASRRWARKPVPFSQYCYPLLRFSRENHFAYKYRDWPADSAEMQAARQPQARVRTRDNDGPVARRLGKRLIELNKFQWMLGAGRRGSRATS